MDTLNEISLQIGSLVSYQNKSYLIRQLTGNLKTVMLEDLISGRLQNVPIQHLSPVINKPDDASQPIIPLEMVSDEQWAIAQKRLAIIQPLLTQKADTELIKKIAKDNKLGVATLYRWLKLIETTGQLSTLIPKRSDGGRGKNRLSPEIEAIIKAAIEDVFLTKQRNPLKRVYLDLIKRCKQHQLAIPHLNTVRNRVSAIREEKKLRFRYGNKAADDQYMPTLGHFPGADFPLAVVQIDHTPADVILVDELTRVPLGRPWITMAIDVYSRMVVGFYVSFETPGALGVGMCVANSILAKEAWLNRLDVLGEWPCWGKMKKIYVDNAKEFRGTMLKRACEEYGIDLEWRPVHRPNYGGHIERLMGTLATEIHTLPGTTFSNSQQRGAYNSANKAALTLTEFEKWLTHLIVNIYHKRIHTSLGKTPLEMFEEGIYQKTGLPPRITNELKAKMDFLPYFERSVQEYGVLLDHIHYYSDVLQKWIHATEVNSGKAKRTRKFIFKRDPRDISVLFFYDPEELTYYPIPYRDISRPPMTLWEHRQALARLTTTGVKQIDEAMLFEAYQTLLTIEQQAVTKTQIARHQRKRAKSQSSLNKSIKENLEQNTDQKIDKKPAVPHLTATTPLNFSHIEPFDELDYESFN